MSDTRKVKGTAILNLYLPLDLEVNVPTSASKYDVEEKLQDVKLSVEETRAALLHWVQNASDEDIEYLSVDDHMVTDDFQEIPKVTARVTPDPSMDPSIPDVAEVDATGYLEKASDEEIKKLIDCELGGDYPADAIYEHYRGIPELGEIEEYLAEDPNPGGNDARGYEVHVDETEFRRWLEARRPELVDYLNNNEPLPGI